MIALLLLSTRFGKVSGFLPKTDPYTTYQRRAGIVVRLNYIIYWYCIIKQPYSLSRTVGAPLVGARLIRHKLQATIFKLSLTDMQFSQLGQVVE